MGPNELIEKHIDLAAKVAMEYAGRKGDLFDELHSICLTPMVEWANQFDPKKSPDGYEGFGPSTVQRCEWSIQQYLSKEEKIKKREPRVLDDIPEGETKTLVQLLKDKKQDDPTKMVEAKELIEARPSKVLKVSEMTVVSPIPEAGKWVADLRAACFDAVRPQDMTEIMKTVVKRAKSGDLRATQLLLDYLCGGRTGGITQQVVIRESEEK